MIIFHFNIISKTTPKMPILIVLHPMDEFGKIGLTSFNFYKNTVAMHR